MHTFDKAFLLDGTVVLSPSRRAPVKWQARNTIQQNENELLDTRRSNSFNSCSSGVPVTLIGQEGIRCAVPFQRQGKSGAAPATVGGESFSQTPLGFAKQSPGRLRRVKTREPGDLPERRHPSDVRWARAGRISAVVTSTLCHADGGRHDDA